jgi:hypothetical protein
MMFLTGCGNTAVVWSATPRNALDVAIGQGRADLVQIGRLKETD